MLSLSKHELVSHAVRTTGFSLPNTPERQIENEAPQPHEALALGLRTSK